jgi:diguanylate cyclase (GGDEF)-like protein/PAS domain S-box-containing protein
MPRQVDAIFPAAVESTEGASDCNLAAVALTQYDARFCTLFEESSSVMLVVEPSRGVIVKANRAASAYYGYTRDQLIGLPISRVNTLPSEETALEWERALREERNHFNFRHRLACGEERDVEVYSSPINVDGRRLLFSIVHDVSARTRAEAQLRDSEERYRSTFEQAAVGIVHSTIEGRFLRCNARFAEIIGYPLEEVGGLTFQQITPPEDLAEGQRLNQQLWTGAAAHATLEKRYIRKDGSLIWARLTFSLLRDSEGRALHSIAMVEDINALKASQEALRISETHYRTIFHTSLDGIAISQMSDGRYIDVNKALLDLLGYEREEMIGRTSVELGCWVGTKDRLNMLEALRQKSCVRDLKVRYRRKNGELFWIQISSTLLEIEGVACLLSLVRNISDAKAAEDEIRSLAFYDPLTHLPNRRLLMDRLRQVLAGSNRKDPKHALLLVGLDHFKTLNDSLGHDTGDLLLQEVSRRILLCVRDADTVARLGGDEFAILLDDLGSVPEEAAARAEFLGRKILAAVSKPHLLAGREWHTTCSIGINVFGDQVDVVNEVLPQADIAMDQAKAAGRNTIRFFAPALQAAINARASMEVDLRRAIKTQEFRLYYQPQIDRGNLTGAEALIRWIHPAHGVVPPGSFIPLAETTGLILPLGKWALETACRQIAAWSDRTETANLTVAVNISAREFRQPNFIEQVLSALYRTGANPQRLKLELTESMLVENIEAVIATMTELRSHGLRFSLDDFGTGYSSLAYLRRLPLDQLKIDRSFVRDMLVDVASGAIAQTIISLGRVMGLPVIAEGVETEEQRDFLAGLGCNSFQGYLFSRPLPLEEFELLLEERPGDMERISSSASRG